MEKLKGTKRKTRECGGPAPVKDKGRGEEKRKQDETEVPCARGDQPGRVTWCCAVTAMIHGVLPCGREQFKPNI
jgi:hypothetical protein